ncbi:MAG: hypothetical protein ACON42_02650 [Flavobacteriaceae bacterium]
MNGKAKKIIVLGTLFFLPLFVYMFFASGKNNFARLPVLTTNVPELQAFRSSTGELPLLEDKITILGFWGKDLALKKAEALNLNEKIYKRFYQFQDFQFVFLAQEGEQAAVDSLRYQLQTGAGTDLAKWHVLYGDSLQLAQQFRGLATPYTLSTKGSSPYVFIIDKNRALRGRTDDKDVDTLWGVNAQSVAQIHKKMVDDVKVILAEYRLALKKYNVERPK